MKLLLLALLFSVSAVAAPGDFQAFDPYSVAPDAITTKGGLLTSDGVDQLVSPACADDEILVWDSAQSLGFKCEAKPAGGGAPTLYQYINPSTVNTSSTSLATIPGFSLTVTATGNPITILCSRCASTNTSSATYLRAIYRDGTKIHEDFSEGTRGGMTFAIVDNPPAGTYTYTVRWRMVTAGTTFTPTTATFSILAY